MTFFNFWKLRNVSSKARSITVVSLNTQIIGARVNNSYGLGCFEIKEFSNRTVQESTIAIKRLRCS